MIARLHYITQDVTGTSHAQLAELACKGGVRWVQCRIKNKNEAEWKAEALAVQSICKKYGAKFILNDNVRLAKELNADGIHLGKEDMEINEARKIIGDGKIIGATANTAEDIIRILQTSADYIGLGPFRFTSTKKNLSPVLGLERISSIQEKAGKNALPIIAIGGILNEDVKALMKTGIHGIAVSSAINLDPEPEKAAASFLESIQAMAGLTATSVSHIEK